MEAAKVACIGVGNIGRAWAISFARGGCRVSLFDTNEANLARSLEQIDSSLADLEHAGLIDDPSAIKARIATSSDLEAAVRDSVHVQECIIEHLELKKELFGELDQICDPQIVIASSSSEFMASELIESVKWRNRVLVAHPFNPPHLIPVVEIAGHSGTSASTVSQTRRFLEGIGMKPIVVKKEIKAFLLNRLQAAVVAEALYLVGEGYCSATDLDRAMSDGLGLRWAFMGPFQTGHLNASGGYRDYMRDDSFGATFRRMTADLQHRNDWPYELVEQISAELEETIPADSIAKGQRWRDRRLMALIKHKAGEQGFDKTQEGQFANLRIPE